MTVTGRSSHIAVVDAWLEKNAKNSSPEELIHLFEKATHAVCERALVTLSGITLEVVLDRVLHQSKEDFPYLAEVRAETIKVNFSGLLAKIDSCKSDALLAALRHLLVELLTVLGNITAEVLTAPLHRELLKVKRERNGSQDLSLRPMPSAKTNRDDK